MTADEITAFVEGLPGVSTVVADEAGGAPEVAWGDSFFSYEQAKMPFATIVTKDYGEFDAFSRARPAGGVPAQRRGRAHRVRGADRVRARRARPSPSTTTRELDRLLPHPVYAPQGWVCIVNPGERTDAQARDLLAAAHERARRRYRGSSA